MKLCEILNNRGQVIESQLLTVKEARDFAHDFYEYGNRLNYTLTIV